MSTISIEVGDLAERINTAFSEKFGYSPQTRDPNWVYDPNYPEYGAPIIDNPESIDEFVSRMLAEYTLNIVRNYEIDQAVTKARNAVVVSLNEELPIKVIAVRQKAVPITPIKADPEV
jgi:hypothetical protein